MASNVIVLTPNGRRQTVKVTPNTTLLQILEEACTKHGYKSNEFDIKHHRKVLDATSTIRFSGLPNNALLEMVEATVTRTESDVILGIQMEDGNRLMGNFSPSTNLWEILTKLCPNELGADKSPVVIYMRQEIYGLNGLQNTNLRSLGLTGGRAMLRLVQRSPETLRTQANVSAPLPSKPVEEKPYIRQFQRLESPETTTTSTLAQSINQSEPKAQPKHDNTESEVPKKLQMQQKTDTINMSNMIKQEKRKQTDGIRTKNQPRSEQKEVLTKKHKEDELVFLGARNAMLFSLETAQAVRSDDLPEDFFDLTITDVKKLFRDIKRQRLEMENGPLMTSAMRNLEENKKQLRQLKSYKKAVIRVQFPTRIVLQGTFIPSETIGTVIDFVREYLEDKSTNFYLFTTPPKSILPKDARLIETDCVPGALLHFGSDKKCENYIRKDLLEKMTSTSIASFAAAQARQENELVHNPIPTDLDLKELAAANDVNVGASTSAGASTSYEDYEKKSVVATTSPEKVPKWFKPTK